MSSGTAVAQVDPVAETGASYAEVRATAIQRAYLPMVVILGVLAVVVALLPMPMAWVIGGAGTLALVATGIGIVGALRVAHLMHLE